MPPPVRLLHDAAAGAIATCNTWIQDRAGTSHTAIRTRKSLCKVVGSTLDVDARDNTSTTDTGSARGVPCRLNGARVADDCADFHDGAWADEASPRDGLGNSRALTGTAP